MRCPNWDKSRDLENVTVDAFFPIHADGLTQIQLRTDETSTKCDRSPLAVVCVDVEI